MKTYIRLDTDDNVVIATRALDVGVDVEGTAPTALIRSGHKIAVRDIGKGSMDNTPSPGNKQGGLTTILDKSLGAAAKGGTSPLNGVYKYAEAEGLGDYEFVPWQIGAVM